VRPAVARARAKVCEALALVGELPSSSLSEGAYEALATADILLRDLGDPETAPPPVAPAGALVLIEGGRRDAR
jgi:hypothetical protein